MTSSQFLNPSRNQGLPSSHLSTSVPLHFNSRYARCLGVRANWTRTMSKSSLGAFVFITSLAPTVRLSQKDFTLGRNDLPLATQPWGATPNGTTSGLLSTWLCSHGPHTSLLPCPHFSCSFFSCVYALHMCMYVHTWARVRYMCIFVICMLEKAQGCCLMKLLFLFSILFF